MIQLTVHPVIKASRFLNCDGSIKIVCDPASFFMSIEDQLTKHVNQLGAKEKTAVIDDTAVFLVTLGQTKIVMAGQQQPSVSSPPP